MEEQNEKKAIEEMATVILEKSELSVVDIAENVARILFKEGYRMVLESYWELYGDKDTFGNINYCAVCGGSVNDDLFWDKDYEHIPYKYCPHCGAKMK